MSFFKEHVLPCIFIVGTAAVIAGSWVVSGRIADKVQPQAPEKPYTKGGDIDMDMRLVSQYLLDGKPFKAWYTIGPVRVIDNCAGFVDYGSPGHNTIVCGGMINVQYISPYIPNTCVPLNKADSYMTNDPNTFTVTCPVGPVGPQ